MKKFYLIIAIAVLVFSLHAQTRPYCTASGSTNHEHITNVQFGTIDNPSGNDAYADYTNISTTVDNGQSLTITVQIGSYFSNDFTTVWVDWNQDDDFADTGESYSVTGNQTQTGTILVPAAALPGATRMRVRMQWTGTPDPCGTTSYGEVEDYTVVLSAGDNDIKAISVTGDIQPHVGVPRTYTVTVENCGNFDQTTYTVHLMMEATPNDIELGNVAGLPILSDQLIPYDFSWTPTVEGFVNLYGTTNLANDENIYNDDSPPLIVEVLPSQTGIAGNIIDISGLPVFDAQVLIEELMIVAYSDSNGYYEMTNVTPGTYTVTVSHQDFSSQTLNNVVIVLDQLTLLDFTLINGGSISGTVLNEIGEAIPQVLVSIDNAALSMYTDNAGAYSFTNVLTGVYSITASLIAHESQTNTGVTVVAGQDTQSDFTLNRKAAYTANVSVTYGEVDSVTITLTDEIGSELYTTITDTSGTYTFDPIEPTTYTVTAEKPGYETYTLTGLVLGLAVEYTEDIALAEWISAPQNLAVDNFTALFTWDDVIQTRGVSHYKVFLEGNYVDTSSTSQFQFDVEDLTLGTTYTAGVSAVFVTDDSEIVTVEFTYTDIANDNPEQPAYTGIVSCYPNPFNPTTNIVFNLAKPQATELVVYNILGQRVKTLHNGQLDSGQHTMQWTGDNESGKSVASGVYYCVLKTCSKREVQKLLLMK
ncbi:MAG: carboxypeptidase regulatory-like domain-containing protein [Candidatus Cloacimonetes bacterium]|nr:carboxypeptidase regulatory-like domain-containing protein [Candidatus Cloacimonadota bacterium]